MIDEKTMVADTLAGINGELTRFGEMIPQTENKQLKQTLKQLRNACETSQEEIYQLARAHQYYVPAEKASVQEVQHVKNILTQGSSNLPSQTKHRRSGSSPAAVFFSFIHMVLLFQGISFICYLQLTADEYQSDYHSLSLPHQYRTNAHGSMY